MRGAFTQIPPETNSSQARQSRACLEFVQVYMNEYEKIYVYVYIHKYKYTYINID